MAAGGAATETLTRLHLSSGPDTPSRLDLAAGALRDRAARRLPGRPTLLLTRRPVPRTSLATMLKAVTTGLCRFDDIRSARAWVFDGVDSILTAHSPHEVCDVLSKVDALTEDGAWAWGYVSYEAAPAFDSAFQVRESNTGDLPLACFAIGPPPRIEPVISQPPRPPTGPSTWRLDWTASDHRERVDGLREAIAAGDVFQVNLTSHFRGNIDGPPRHLYASLAHAQRGAHNAYLQLDLGLAKGPVAIACASPELFFQWEADRITCRPMKGTSRRALTTIEDEQTGAELVSSSKQRAENLMIVDLIRNDLSRLAEVGTVQVRSLFDVEKFETVWQLTSTVSAQLLADTGLRDIFAAIFPCGSVTGAPKAAAMGLITKHETGPRGVYCGAIGMVAPPGSEFRARFSVPIRTATISLGDGAVGYGVGGGITWDSDPSEEFDEIQAKAAILYERGAEFRLLETMRFEAGAGLRNLDRHLRRLSDSARYFDIPLDLRLVHDAIDEMCRTSAAKEPQRVRLLVTRGGRVSIETSPLTSLLTPVSLAIDNQATDPSRWTRHKTTHRTIYERAAKRHPGADDVILVDRSAKPIETTRANLAVKLDGHWVTPPLSRGCLPGVERQRLIDAGHLDEVDIAMSDVVTADEIAVVSSLRGWRQAHIVRSPVWLG